MRELLGNVNWTYISEREVVFAGGDWFGTSGREGGSEELNVTLLEIVC